MTDASKRRLRKVGEPISPEDLEALRLRAKQPRKKSGPTKPLDPVLPEFMRSDARKWMRENRDLWVEAARYSDQRGLGSEIRLHVIQEAKQIQDVKSLRGWQLAMIDHVTADLEEGGTSRVATPDRPARAFYTLTAIKRLLQLVQAPAYLQAELEHFLKSSLPADIENKAKLQAVLIDCPDQTNVTQIAASVGISRRLVKRWLDDGSVQRMP